MDHWFNSDTQFHHLYPPAIQQLARRHWTPPSVANQAVQFLVPKDGVRILDIGSGVGAFCLGAAYYKPNAIFYGVEQRKNLVDHAEAAKNVLGLSNVTFIHGDFTQLNLRRYDHFYFYNSFYEHVKGTPKIDYNLSFSETLYNYYNRFLFKKLEEMPVGTRVVTRCSWEDKIPSTYKVVNSDFDSMLKFHIKG
ncbi:class I SAM-dependent methyltransferase [Flavitalea sp. BT771]|uniref:class I SAM-dependent methyltransferase n=1 Tax=Flavitalea sp. BT771 TaxID=3063329 RepID=UPI0026E154A4|nr:class I SAM-dependent methyltransferase [Flavitalea sp. BT771]MDO6430240.1 class I SAM-dependent methyltransferase [Flavitalea sp. BT771]MDV6219620.1 class I SAM-dependent methyltransferase [Flavitalea sp. BT771]